MTTNTHSHIPHPPKLRSYLIGYGLSVLLTFAAFGLAFLHTLSSHVELSHEFLIYAVIGLALVQLFVQAVFFLHLSRRADDQHNLVAFMFTIFIVLFIGIGSLWIMHNLNYNMTEDQVDTYLHKEN